MASEARCLHFSEGCGGFFQVAATLQHTKHRIIPWHTMPEPGGGFFQTCLIDEIADGRPKWEKMGATVFEARRCPNLDGIRPRLAEHRLLQGQLAGHQKQSDDRGQQDFHVHT